MKRLTPRATYLAEKEKAERERRAVDSRRQQLLRETERLSGALTQPSPQAEQASLMLRDTLVQGDFSLQLSALLSQANVSRSFVVALLGL